MGSGASRWRRRAAAHKPSPECRDAEGPSVGLVAGTRAPPPSGPRPVRGGGTGTVKAGEGTIRASAGDNESDAWIDPSRFIAEDQEIVHSGDVWKLNFCADPQEPREWLKRKMWLTDTGGLFYYSCQFGKPLGCYIARLSVQAPERRVLERFIIELYVESKLGVPPTILAAESEESRQMWVQCFRCIQDRERQKGQDEIDPLEPFVGHGMHNGRKRLSRKMSGELMDVQAQGNFKPCHSSSSSSSSESGNSGRRLESFGDRLMQHCSTIASTRTSIKVCHKASIGPSVFTSAKPATGPSMINRRKIRRDSQANFSGKGHTVLVLDWDDTLFPTTFIRKDLGLDWRYTIDEQVKPGPARTHVERLLDKLSDKVEAVVNTACSLAQVVIVTLANSPWVEASSQNFMPRLNHLIREQHIKVVYAREQMSEAAQQEYHAQAFKTSADEANFWMRAKAEAMEEEFRNRHGRAGASWKNLISIGDSDFERAALLTVASEHFEGEAKHGQIVETGLTSVLISKDGHLQRLRAKTLKMLDEPSCEELIAQATLIASWLPYIVNKDAGFDVDLLDSTDDNHLHEVNLRITGKDEGLRWMVLAGLAAAEGSQMQ